MKRFELKIGAAAVGRRIRHVAGRIKEKFGARDLLIAAGVSCLAIGIRRIDVTLAWIVVGALLFYLGVWHPLISTAISRRRQ